MWKCTINSGTSPTRHYAISIFLSGKDGERGYWTHDNRGKYICLENWDKPLCVEIKCKLFASSFQDCAAECMGETSGLQGSWKEFDSWSISQCRSPEKAARQEIVPLHVLLKILVCYHCEILWAYALALCVHHTIKKGWNTFYTS